MSSKSPHRRERAPQGSGEKLQAEIVAAASRLLIASGNPELVSLRAVAREVGIAAPSIYLHFADRDSLLLAVLIDAEQRFEKALHKASLRATDPKARCHDIGIAYERFAQKHKGAYQTLFSGLLPSAIMQIEVTSDEDLPGSFAVLYRAVSEVCEARKPNNRLHRSAMNIALQMWCGLHGYVTLSINMPGFPWPSPSAFISEALMPLLP